jgi:hypothetical protein
MCRSLIRIAAYVAAIPYTRGLDASSASLARMDWQYDTQPASFSGSTSFGSITLICLRCDLRFFALPG